MIKKACLAIILNICRLGACGLGVCGLGVCGMGVAYANTGATAATTTTTAGATSAPAATPVAIDVYQPDETQLQELLVPMAQFQAKFEQVVIDASGRMVERLAGKVAISRPGKFRWDYSEPDPQLILADGVNLWVYDPDLEQVTVRPQTEALDALPSLFLSGQAKDILDNFEVKIYTDAARLISQIILLPKQSNANISMIGLGVEAGVPTVMEFEDKMGQATQILFTQYRALDDNSDTLFKIDIPAGVDIVGQPQ